uniref:Putative secreted peptide n=1 Tax=Anopheles braziliensis TaxID=58242 RepID=A0A2M3ZWF9_9DIPT
MASVWRLRSVAIGLRTVAMASTSRTVHRKYVATTSTLAVMAVVYPWTGTAIASQTARMERMNQLKNAHQ